ncbi:MAG: hypothetical protein WDO73_17290 [Ignavibacteriota bacterium]
MLVHPAITTALGCCELTGITPGCNANRSVKLLPFTGMPAILVALREPPDCVSAVCTWLGESVTVTLSLCDSTVMAMSTR